MLSSAWERIPIYPPPRGAVPVYLRQSGSQRYLIALNFSGQEQIVKLPEMGHGRILLSTCLDSEEPVNLAFLRLRSNEGNVIEVAMR